MPCATERFNLLLYIYDSMSDTYESVPCNLCGENNEKQIVNRGKFDLVTNVVICKNCGLSYLSPRLDKESYTDFYRHEYDRLYRSDIHRSKPKTATLPNPIEARLNSLGILKETAGKILEIGSGAGENLLHFKSLFPKSELYAIEPSEVSKKILQENKVTWIGGDVDQEWEGNYKETFDIVIMRHVLEHFMDPVAVMKKVKSVIAKNGFVYIAVPNNLFPTQDLQDSWFRNVHTYYFNRYSLKNLCKLAGLKLLTIQEKDSYNRGEIYLVAVPDDGSEVPTFSKDHYEEQLKVFNESLKRESKPLYKLKKRVKKLLK